MSTAAPQSGQKEGQAELVVYRAKENVPVSVKALVVFLGHANWIYSMSSVSYTSAEEDGGLRRWWYRCGPLIKYHCKG